MKDSIKLLHQTKMKPSGLMPLQWKIMENLEEYFCGCLSVTGIPLAYALREKPEVFPEADDPVDNYGSMQDELIAHALILTVANPNAFMATYLSDCQCVWDKIMVITCELDCWMYVHPTQHTRDGHLAYQNLNEHCLGVNNMDIMSTLAEAKLASMTYDGEKDHWNFEKYMKIHIVQHAILAGLVEHGYSSIDERSKVCHLVNDIKTRDLDPVKVRIWSDAMLCNAFDACINLFKDYIAQNPSLSKVPRLQIAKVGTKKKDEDHSEADMSIKDQYYTKAEFSKLTSTQNYGLKLTREKHGHVPRCQSKKYDTTNNDRICLDKQSIKAIATQ